MNYSQGNKSQHLGIPPRWLNCPRKGFLVSEKFLPFKTPLSKVYDDEVPLANRFYPSMLISSLKNYKVKMGLWIDLTNTNRFYGKEDVEAADIKYLKLQCRGHGECPSEDQTQTFIQICNKFMSKHPLTIIGVHCTHGFNRTGFLIVAYLVEILNWSVEAALDEFSKARPPGVYKGDYLKELFRRYGDPLDTPPPPPLPDWCNEADIFDDEESSLTKKLENNCRNSGSEVRHKRRKEFNKKNPTFMEGVPGVTPITTQPTLSQVQRKCQELCGWKGAGFPGSQPISMDNENLILIQQKPYKVSWKADGTRYMMLIDGENQLFFIDRDNAVFQISDFYFPQRKNPTLHIANTLVDGEMIIDKVEDRDVPRYLVYDIIRFEDCAVKDADFDRRLLCINKEIIGPRIQAMKEGRIDRNKEPFSIRAKDFWDVSQAKAILGEKFRSNVTHEIDGLIFQPAGDPYKAGRCLEVLKWKPPSLNSVDFKLVLTKECREGCLPGMRGYLYVGGHDQPFGEIKITKALKLLDKKIIECKFEDGQWKFLRERTDKSFPNVYSTAIAVCNSIRDPVTKEKLLDFIESNRWIPPQVKRSHSSLSVSSEETKRR